MKVYFKLLAIALLTYSCGSSIDVVSDMDKTYDFASIKTAEYYGWAENSDQILSKFDKERIEKAFGEEFKKRNISLAQQGQGDVIVSLYIVTEDKTQTTATTTTTGMGYGYGGYGGYYGYGPGYGWGGGYSTTDINTYNYTVGTLLVSVFDAKKKELIWQSAGSGTIDENPEHREKNIPIAVKYIMAKYPVKPVTPAK